MVSTAESTITRLPLKILIATCTAKNLTQNRRLFSTSPWNAADLAKADHRTAMLFETMVYSLLDIWYQRIRSNQSFVLNCTDSTASRYSTRPIPMINVISIYDKFHFSKFRNLKLIYAKSHVGKNLYTHKSQHTTKIAFVNSYLQ